MKLGTVLLGGLAATVVACGTAKTIRKDQYGGVIQLEGDRSKAWQQANHLMKQHCQPQDVTILSEADEVVGVEQSGTRDTTALRVQYACGRPKPAQGTY